MPMPAVLGTIAQQGQSGGGGGGGGSGSAPTGVEIYDSNGGTIRTCGGECITLGSSGENALDDLLAGDFSTQTATIALNFNADYSAQLNNNSGNLDMRYGAYMTATGATSFEWDVYAFTINQDLNSALSSWSATGSATTTQDATLGLGENARLTHNSGGRGYLMLAPAFGGNSADSVSHKIRGIATNSAGDTQASQLQVTWECT